MSKTRSILSIQAEKSVQASRLLSSTAEGKSKEKKKRRGTKKVKKGKDFFSKLDIINPFEIPGVTKLILSPVVQKLINCTVGDDVTTENPWKYVPKETIADNIDLHEDSSEFLPIKQDVVRYPEAEMLFGLVAEESEIHDAFYIVHTSAAKETVLKIIEKQQEELQERLKRSVWRPVGRWQSLGSEKEINESLIQNFRPLYEIELYSKFPLIGTKVSFNMRKVEDAIDGYVELLPDARFPVTNVSRKRVDVSVQAAPDKVENEAQTTPTYPMNIWTQYEYEYKEKQLNVHQNKNITEFMLKRVEILDDTIRVNKHINMFEDDYAALTGTTRHRIDSTGKMKTFLSLSDVNTCKSNYVVDCSWNQFISGLVAVCYADVAASVIIHEQNKNDVVTEAVNGCCPVLVWSYTDGLKPKLYLESPRQVTYLSFCPYDKNILVGGCINGQVVVWDISNKLDQVEAVEVLTSKQKRNRLTILSMMSWMKNTRDVAFVQPTIISSLQYSHKDMITTIAWVFHNVQIATNGQVKKIESGNIPALYSRQFMTGSLDGTVMFWDLAPNLNKEVNKKSERKTKRFQKKPSALTVDVSPYKEFNKIFKPVYRVIIFEQDKPCPVLSIIRKTNFLNYEIIGVPNSNEEIRSHYKLSETQQLAKCYPFVCGTDTGKLIKYSWEGFNFSTGQEVNSEQCTMIQFQYIHDGPIVYCNAHPSINEIFLTVGGSVFAVWAIYGPTYPLIWRRVIGSKYLAGGWTSEHSAFIILIRSDGSFELWDFLLSSVKPTRIIRLGGDKITNILGTITSPHCRKNTFATADNVGNLTIFYTPDILKMHIENEDILCRILFKNSAIRREHCKNWIQKFKENLKKGENISSVQSEEDQIIPPKRQPRYEVTKRRSTDRKLSEIDKMDIIFSSVQWNSLQEKVMYEAELKRKKLNLAELEQQKIPLQKIAAEKRRGLARQEKMLSNKEKIFANIRTQMFLKFKTARQRQYSLHHVDDDIALAYLEHYDEIEKRSLNYIDVNEYCYNFEWSKVLEQGRERRRKIESFLQFGNLHNRRNMRILIREAVKREAAEPDYMETEDASEDVYDKVM